MNPTLRALLAGVLVTGAGGVVYTYATSTTTFADLQTTGIAVDCNPRLIVCSERINPVLRNRLEDAGDVLLATKKYARIVRQAHRCLNPDGGEAELIVPGLERFATDADMADVPEPRRCIDRPCADFPGFCGQGPKQVRLASAMTVPLLPECVRAPVGNATCLRDPPGVDGPAFFGEMNVFPAAQAVGVGCEAVECAVMYGDHPDEDL